MNHSRLIEVGVSAPVSLRLSVPSAGSQSASKYSVPSIGNWVCKLNWIAWKRWPVVQVKPGIGVAGHTNQHASPNETLTCSVPSPGMHSPRFVSHVNDAPHVPQLPPRSSPPQSRAAQRGPTSGPSGPVPLPSSLVPLSVPAGGVRDVVPHATSTSNPSARMSPS